MTPYINIGDSFAFVAKFKSKHSRLPIEITPDMVIASRIVNQKEEQIAVCQVTVFPDQVNNKGCVQFEVDKQITQNWKTGSAHLDIKLSINGKVKSSGTYSFTIKKGIT